MDGGIVGNKHGLDGGKRLYFEQDQRRESDRFFGHFIHSINRFGGLVGGIIRDKFSLDNDDGLYLEQD